MADVTKITYYLTTSEYINTIDVALGNLIFCEDTKRVYFDGDNGRVSYDSLLVFETDADRHAYAHPMDGFYFVEETKIMWRYSNGEWTAITEPPTNNVIFIPKSELPTKGEFATLYICDTEMFIWSPTENKYIPMNADSIWHEV